MDLRSASIDSVSCKKKAQNGIRYYRSSSVLLHQLWQPGCLNECTR